MLDPYLVKELYKLCVASNLTNLNLISLESLPAPLFLSSHINVLEIVDVRFIVPPHPFYDALDVPLQRITEFTLRHSPSFLNVALQNYRIILPSLTKFVYEIHSVVSCQVLQETLSRLGNGIESLSILINSQGKMCLIYEHSNI